MKQQPSYFPDKQIWPRRLPWLLIILALSVILVATTGGTERTAAAERLEIQLLYATFDPLHDPEPAVPPALQARPDSPYALLQFSGPIQDNWIETLKAAGVTFYSYLPRYSYVVRLPSGNLEPIAAYPMIRWVGPLHPAYKISPTARPGLLRVSLFPDVDGTAAVTAVTTTGAALQSIDAAGRLMTVEADTVALNSLATLDVVQWIQAAVPMAELNDDVRWLGQSAIPDYLPLTERGLTGSGQVGAISDSGLAVYDFSGNNQPGVANCYFLDDGSNGAGGSALPPSPAHRKIVGYVVPPGAGGDMVDGSGHGSHVAGSIVGDRPPWNSRSTADGGAYASRLFFQDIGTGDIIPFINPPADYGILFGQAYDPNGDGQYQPGLEPRTHSNSWGAPDPIYSVESAQTDAFMWHHPDFLILYAAGNQGPAANTVGYPATAKNIVTVGATENGMADPDNVTYFSSHGPAPLGRIKPTITAPGDRVLSAARGSACGLTEKSGTSMATPVVHGLTLLMRQYLWDGYYPSGTPTAADRIHPSAALLKALLIGSGRPLSGDFSDNGAGGGWPSNGQGWGRVVADDVLYLQGDRRNLWLHDAYALDGSVGFGAAGESASFTLTVADGEPFGSEPLRISLVWSDYPGEPMAGGALVNDLDLIVTGPDGALHLGNDILSNDFQPGTDLPTVAPDRVNPWEVVYLENPVPGRYTITVTAANLGSLALDTVRKQGFALIATGDLVNQPEAEIEFPLYEVAGPEVARLRVTDPARNVDSGQTETVVALVSSEQQPGGLSVTLLETAADSGIFHGTVTLSPAGPASGQLLVTTGDTVELRYESAAGQVTTDAARIGPRPVALINPPQLSAANGTGASNPATLDWSPAAGSGLGGYIIQESATYAVPLADDAEGTIGANWSSGAFLSPWRQNGLFQQSGLNSFWSGRGDTNILIDTSLTLNHDVTVPEGVTSARLSFYSRYFNDFDDTGYVEISTDGGASWQQLRRLYANPRLVPADTEMRFHQFDLGEYIGQPFRIRFRYNNGIVFFPPDSHGWWVDDITISGAVWRTIATTGEGATEYLLTDQPDGLTYYRVQAIYRDGSATGWSNVVPLMKDSPPPVHGEATGGGWLAGIDGGKLNFSFDIAATDEWLGELQLHDKVAGVRIRLTELSGFSEVGEPCGTVASGDNAVEFRGNGTFNGAAATFRVCLQDNGEPGHSRASDTPDRFYLACLTGCSYRTSDRTTDASIDGGNIDVDRTPGDSAENGEASTIILDPLLLSDGLVGQLQAYTVTVYDSAQAPLADAPVNLTRTHPDGTTETFTTVTDLTGTATFSLLHLDQVVEYQATSGNSESNTIEVTPLLN